MKNTKYLLLTILMTITLGIKAQETGSVKIPYKIDFAFTGEIRGGMDSVFNAVLVIDENLLPTIKKAILKHADGKEESALKTNSKKIKGVVTDNGKVYINLGEANWRIPLPEVNIETNDGGIIKVYEGEKGKEKENKEEDVSDTNSGDN